MKDEDADNAVKVLNEEFRLEIEDGRMFPMHAEVDLHSGGRW